MIKEKEKLSKLEIQLQKKKILFAITKANTVKEELDMKIAEFELQIENFKYNIITQDREIEKRRAELKELEEKIKTLNI